MYHFKLFNFAIIASCLVGSLGFAETSGEAKIEDYDGSAHWGLSLGYVSWQES